MVIGEQRGEGVKVGARCLWDADADSYASDVFLAVSKIPVSDFRLINSDLWCLMYSSGAVHLMLIVRVCVYDL